MVVQPKQKKITGLSIFDLDRTLLRCTLGFRFFVHLLKSNMYSYGNLFQVLTISIRYKLGLFSARMVHEKIAALFLESSSAKALLTHFSVFSKQFSLDWVNKKVLKKLHEAKNRGHYTVLSTSCPTFLVQPLLAYFPFDELYASTYHVDEKKDRFFLVMAVDGVGKKEHSQALSKKFDLPKQHLYAYSDSISDLPLLEAVGNPVVVCPDRKLKKIASLRRWEKM